MADNFQQNPMGYDPNVQQAVNNALADEKKKKKKKKLIILAVIVIIIIGIIGIASSGDDDKADTKPINSDTSSSQSVDEDIDKDSDSKNEDKIPSKIKAGTAITVDDVEISYISCDADNKNYDQYSGPASGNKIVRAEFSFKNVGSTDRSLGSFECYADGQKCETYIFADDYASTALESISSGRTLKCVEYFEVPASAEEIELEYDADFWSSDKIIFVIE